MQPLIVTSLDDKRIEPYRELKQPNRRIRETVFIVEGEKLAARLLASEFETESVLLSDRYDATRLAIPEHITTYVADQSLIEKIIGFPFHRGVLACGRRKPFPTIDEVLIKHPERWTAIVCPVVYDPENIGQILRIGAAFGVDFLLMGPSCPDLFSRRVLRVSMGSIFGQTVIQSGDLRQDLRRLRVEQDAQLIATVLDPTAEPLSTAERPDRMALVFGTEGDGLGQEWIELCDRMVTIPMRPGTDSLNVAVATGIFLYHFLR